MTLKDLKPGDWFTTHGTSRKYLVGQMGLSVIEQLGSEDRSTPVVCVETGKIMRWLNDTEVTVAS